jgi:hypothetical protein
VSWGPWSPGGFGSRPEEDMLKRYAVLLSTFVLLLGFVPKAHATGIDCDPGTTLGSLIANQGYIDQGDKRFSDFSFELESSDLSKTSPDDASGIRVAGVTLGGNHGLAFFPAGFDNLFFARDGAQLKIVMGYKVSVLDPDLAVSDIHLSMGSLTFGDASISVTESVYGDAARTDLLAQAQVTNPPELFDADIVDLDPAVAMAFVTKEILIDAGACDLHSNCGYDGCRGFGTIGFIKQLVSQGERPQEVPEPATILLLGAGLLGLISRLRRGFGLGLSDL